MSQIRIHQLTGYPVIFAPKRKLRPHDFKGKKEFGGKVDFSNCPFCVGHETETPPEIFTFPERKPANSPGWTIRVVPNKFSALASEEELIFKKEKTSKFLEQQKSAFGYHEVIITKAHFTSLADLSDRASDWNWAAIIRRIKEICQNPKIKYPLLIYNYGGTAGASLVHPHSQLFALDFVPPYVEVENRQFQLFHNRTGKHLLTEIITQEIKEKKRVLKETKNFLAWCPYGSRKQFEVWIAPKKKGEFLKLEVEQRKELALLTRFVLKQYQQNIGDPDFNFYLHLPPVNQKSKKYQNFHWHLEILPMISIWAGFELGSGVVINSVWPEEGRDLIKKINF